MPKNSDENKEDNNKAPFNDQDENVIFIDLDEDEDNCRNDDSCTQYDYAPLSDTLSCCSSDSEYPRLLTPTIHKRPMISKEQQTSSSLDEMLFVSREQQTVFERGESVSRGQQTLISTEQRASSTEENQRTSTGEARLLAPTSEEQWASSAELQRAQSSGEQWMLTPREPSSLASTTRQVRLPSAEEQPKLSAEEQRTSAIRQRRVSSTGEQWVSTPGEPSWASTIRQQDVSTTRQQGVSTTNQQGVSRTGEQWVSTPEDSSWASSTTRHGRVLSAGEHIELTVDEQRMLASRDHKKHFSNEQMAISSNQRQRVSRELRPSFLRADQQTVRSKSHQASTISKQQQTCPVVITCSTTCDQYSEAMPDIMFESFPEGSDHVPEQPINLDTEFDLFGRIIGCQLKKLPEIKALKTMAWIQSYIVKQRLTSASEDISSSVACPSFSKPRSILKCNNKKHRKPPSRTSCFCEDSRTSLDSSSQFSDGSDLSPIPPIKKIEQPKSGALERRHPTYRPKSRTDTNKMESARLRGDGGASSDDDTLSRQNQDLRQRLQEEAAHYRKRLDTYRQAQQNQAALVSRLQAKVLQYKQRCAELETHIGDRPISPEPIPTRPTSLHIQSPSSSALEEAQQHLRELKEERVYDLEGALKRLDEERRRNERLRGQLFESQSTNEALTNDLQKLTNDFENLREEMIIKEDEWKDEEQAFNDYYSSEHSRLLHLWKDVVSVKRLFNEVQSTTEKDLFGLKSEFNNISHEMALACSRMDRNIAFESIVGGKEKHQYEQELLDLRSQIDTLQGQHQSLQTEVKIRDDRVQQLLHEVQNLEDRCAEAEQSVGQVIRIQENADILHGALRDIAHALIQDSEITDLSTTHLHLTPSTSMPEKSPKRGSSRISSSAISPAAFAESTISAVQAALHKYQSLIHELQVKLQSNREQLLLVRKQCEHSEGNVVVLEGRVTELVAQLDGCRTQCSKFVEEKDILQKSLDSSKADKNALDRNRMELNAMIESLNVDYEKLQKENYKLQKESDTLTDEKMFLQAEVERLHQEASIREITLHGEEDRCSRMREELLRVREELNKLYLSHDMLEQQKMEGDGHISALEKSKNDLEMQLDLISGERSNTHESLLKKESIASNLELDKKKLQEELKKTQDARMVLHSQCNDQQNDINSLRKELLQAEQARLDLEADKQTLNERIKFLEIDKGKVEMELGQIARERSDLSNQLIVINRKKEALNEELLRTKQRLEQANETNARINRNLEELVKECEDKQCQINANNKEIQHYQEQFSALRTEKETLEAVLFDTQTNLEESDIRKMQLEKDQQDLLVKQESLKGQIAKLSKDLERSEKRCQDIKSAFTQQAGNKEAEFVQALNKLKSQNEDNVKKLTEEREKIRMALEKRMQESMSQLKHEKDSEINSLHDQLANIQNHIENVSQQHEELLLRAENDKQQALLIAHHDQQALQERLEVTRRKLEGEQEALERLKREANGKFDQDRATINQLKDEVNKNKAKLEECKAKGEEEKARLENRIEEIRIERDASHTETENLKVQLHLAENKADDITNQLHDTIRKCKETENNSESLRKELTDVRRQLTDSNFEKEKYHATNKELRDHVKRNETEKREQVRQIEEAFQKISNLEEVKLALDNEKSRLQNTIRDMEKDQVHTDHKMQSLQEDIKKLESSGDQHQAEEKELQGRLLNETEERERTQQELHQLKKQMAELDDHLQQTRHELGRTRSHGAQLEEQWHAREQDLLVHLEDARGREKRLEDQKHNLEVCLVDATQQIQELKARLGGAEGRVRALDGELTHLEGSKRDLEQKLSSVMSTLRRIAGIQLDGSVNMPYRLLSPSRRWSPARTQEADGVVDVDPEVVRKGVRNLMQQVAHIERERDDYKTQISTVKKQLQEAHESQTKGDSKLHKALNNLKALQDEKGSLEAKLGQKAIALQSQNEALQKKTDEVHHMRDKITSLELAVTSGNEEKMQYEDKVEKLKFSLSRLESEKHNLQDELNRTENRCTKLELQRMAMEGDLKRLQMMLQEKDGNIEALKDKCDGQNRAVASLEERCVSLKSTIDQMNLSLERSSGNESELKMEVNRLQKALLETSSTSHANIEKLKQMQKSLSNSENERRVIVERLEASQQGLAELRRNNQILQDQIQRLNTELANNEVQKAGLESQLRLSQWPMDSPISSRDDDLIRQLHSTQRERSELRGKVDSLTNKLHQMETEKRTLERQVTKGVAFQGSLPISKSYERDRPEKYESDATTIESSRFEDENKELRLKIARLEAQLADKEAELHRLRSQRPTMDCKFDRSEIERYRSAQLQAERLLEAREQSHRQQVARLENQVQLLRDQLNQEIKRRQQYVLRSSRAGREMQHLRQTLGDSLRTVSQDPSLDALLLEHEARKLDNTLAHTASLPPALPTSSYDRRSLTPQPK